jgi:hypothetical protein
MNSFDSALERKLNYLKERAIQNEVIENSIRVLLNISKTKMYFFNRHYNIGNVTLEKNNSRPYNASYERDEKIVLCGDFDKNDNLEHLTVYHKSVIGKVLFNVSIPSSSNGLPDYYVSEKSRIRFPKIKNLILFTYFPGNWEKEIEKLSHVNFNDLIIKNEEKERRRQVRKDFSSYFP